MKNLTDFQKAFLLEYFFKNENYAGWKNIANSLLEDGYAIVAGNECIWKGGIGNFIKTSETPQFHGCLKYEFDLNYFLSSEWYQEIWEEYLKQLKEERDEIEKEIEEINNIIYFILK